MTRTGGDWSGAFPGIANLQAAGISFAGRYSAWDHPRGIQAFEEQALNAAGMDILSYYEENESSIMEGAPFGVRAAQTHLSILKALGHPVPTPLHIACDFDASASDTQGAIFSALDGLASVLGRPLTGIYGGVIPVHLARAAGKATYAVQAFAWSSYNAPSLGLPTMWSPLATCHQMLPITIVGGSQVDPLYAQADDFGQWRRPTVAPVFVPDVMGNIGDPNQFAKEPTIRPGAGVSPAAPLQAVARVQFIINIAFGRTVLKVDGQYGPETVKQVQTWQYLGHVSDNNLGEGVIGPNTWLSFGKYDARLHRFDSEPTISFNDIGHPQAVKDLQMALNAVTVHGFTPIPVDGAFGPKTRDTLVQYQRVRNIAGARLGTADRPTWNDLGSLVTRYGK